MVNRRLGLVVALVVTTALALRLPLVDFALPALTHPDEPANVGVGAWMVDHGTWKPISYAYPSLLFDVVAVSAKIQQAFGGYVPGAGITWQNVGVAMTSDPGLLLALRLVTIVLSAGTCVLVCLAVWWVTRNRGASALAGVLLAVSPLIVRSGVVVTPDTYSAFFAAVALFAALIVLRRGRPIDYVMAGAAVGLAAGSKYNAAMVAVAVLTAHLLPHGRRAWRRPEILFAAAASLAVFVITTPGALLDTDKFIAGLTKEIEHYSTGHAGAEGSSGWFYLKALATDMPVLLLSIVCLPLLLRGRYHREAFVVSTFALAYWVLLTTPTVHFDRNLLPLMPALAILIGLLTAQAFSALATRTRMQRAVSLVGASILLAGITWPVWNAIKIADQFREPARHQAADWLSTHLPPRSMIVVEAYGPWLDRRRYRVVPVDFVIRGRLPVTADAVVLTQHAGGRFDFDPERYRQEIAAYRALRTRLCSAVRFDDGPWIEILVPCRSQPRSGD